MIQVILCASGPFMTKNHSVTDGQVCGKGLYQYLCYDSPELVNRHGRAMRQFSRQGLLHA